MSDLIVEYTDFSSDINLDAVGVVETIVVKSAGGGGLALRGSVGTTILTDLVDDESVTLRAKLILAAGTSVAKVRVAFRRKS